MVDTVGPFFPSDTVATVNQVILWVIAVRTVLMHLPVAYFVLC